MESPRRIPGTNRWLRLASSPALPPAPPRPLDDDELIDAVRSGDARRAAELHDRLISVVERTLYRLLGRRERDHDDLVQATFEQLVLTLMRGRFARECSLSTWATTVTTHVALKALRSRRRERKVFDPIDVNDVPRRGASPGDAEREMSIRQQIAMAQSVLAAMNPTKAAVLVLHDVLGHGLVEIAGMLDISSAAAQSRLVRGRREFRRRVEKAHVDRNDLLDDAEASDAKG